MLGAGLRREFPGASAWAAGVASRAPRPRVARSGLVWAVLAALGTQAVVAVLVGSLLPTAFQLWPATAGLLVLMPQLPLPASAIGAFIGWAAGAAVALRCASWSGLLAYAAALVALGLASEALGLRGRALFCARAGELAVLDVCRPREPVEQVLARWPLLAAVLTGVVASRLVALRGEGTNATLEAVGVMVIVTTAARLAVAPLFEPTGDDAMRAIAASSAVIMAAASLAGYLLVRRGGRPWPGAVAVAVVFLLLPALRPALGYYQNRPDGAPAWADWIVVAPAGEALAFVLGAVVTAALSRSPRPDAGAARRAPR